MNHRYSSFERKMRQTYRHFFPMPTSPYITGQVDDMSLINLVPSEQLELFFSDAINLLRDYKGNDIGDYLEFGVFNGNSMSCMFNARTAAEVRSMRLFGFDAFEGLPATAEQEDGGVWKQGSYTCDFETMQICLEKRNVPSNEITWVKGWYEKTLTNDFAQDFDIGNFGIVFIDCDNYGSAKTVLDFLAPRIHKPLVICFDDWKLNDLDIKGMGEYQAYNEFLEANPKITSMMIHSYNRKSRSFLLTL